MKIVINIPEQIYTDIKCGITNGSYDMWLAVAEGQPLSEELDEIKGEIAEIPKKYPMTKEYEYGLNEAMAIIDKHIGKGDKDE